MTFDRLTVTVVAIALPLLGCSGFLEKNATMKLEADCAKMGRQFVKTDSERNDNPLYSQAQVTGVCVGPEDPRYMQSVATPAMRP